MTVTQDSLKKIDKHWAVISVDPSCRKKAEISAQFCYLHKTVGEQLLFNFDNEDNADFITRLATSYEVASIEGIQSLLHPSSEGEELAEQAQAGAYRCFDLLKIHVIPSKNEEKIFHVLHLSALAYCADRWPDIRRWMTEHADEIKLTNENEANWDKFLLFQIYECWIRLLRKRQWEDLHEIYDIINKLRQEQENKEEELFSASENSDNRATALRLISLYHWAKATEILATFILQGEPTSPQSELDQHFESAYKAAQASYDPAFEALLRWLHVAARRMVAGSVWWVSQAVNSRVCKFIQTVTKSRSLFELLPPQRSAIQEQSLLDPASRAVVIDLPTSGGKTTLAQFRILQALNQFWEDGGWVAYVAPTKALVTQITRRLRSDFNPIGVNVEQLTGAIEIDQFEEILLTSTDNKTSFHVLVATPEKLSLVIRNKKISRPLALIVMDEAHNIEDENRGLRIELLLAVIKRDCPKANFLLMMPHVGNASDLTKWLEPESGKTISLGTTHWQPNERLVGMYRVEKDPKNKKQWHLVFESLVTSMNTIDLKGKFQAGQKNPLNLPVKKTAPLKVQTAAMAKVFCEKGTSIAIANKIDETWSMAETIADNLDSFSKIPEEISLVQRFLSTEISPNFQLIELLNKGIAVHHAGLSDETRALIEWLAEEGKLRVLCATTTIAQGINFPVSSVFLSSRFFPYGKEMPSRAFWNLAGRTGRIYQDSVGVIGLAAGKSPNDIRKYVSMVTGDLISNLIKLLDELENKGKELDLAILIREERWADFRSYIAHLWNEKKNLDAVLAETEQVLRNTFGFGVLQAKSQEKAQILLNVSKDYVKKLAEKPEYATLADATGFAPEGVQKAISGLIRLDKKLQLSDWEPSSLFGNINKSALPNLIGIMMNIPDLKNIKEISSQGSDYEQIAKIAQSWVAGMSIQYIAEIYFGSEKSLTESITKTCKAIYQKLANSAPWGISALSQMPGSGINFDKISEEENRRINMLPAMIYHGVQTEEAILMRMNSVPRSAAENLGKEFSKNIKSDSEKNIGIAREFLRSLESNEWDRIKPVGSFLSGEDYRLIWKNLSGEAD